MPEFLFILFAVFIVLAVIYGFYAAAKRRKALTEWAIRKGLLFEPGSSCDMEAAFPAFNCLRRGSSRRAYNIITGKLDGYELTAFDYRYTTGSGKNRRTHFFSAVVLESLVLLKPLSLRRESVFDKVTEFFGLDDIDFESAEFSREFYVKSPDRKWAYDVIHARMMEYLLAAPRFSIQFDRRHVMAWRDTLFEPADFDAAVGLIRGMMDRLPDYLVKQQMESG